MSDVEQQQRGVMRSPAKLLSAADCQAQTLSVSNDHATILLRSKNSGLRSLLKLNVVPNHKDDLSPTISVRGKSVDQLEEAANDEESERIRDFLKKFNFRLTSESGAEYSYYTVTEKAWYQDPVGFLLNRSRAREAFNAELISPATDRQLQRSMPAPGMALVQETPEIYETIVKPHIQSIIESGSLSWIQNIVECKKEVERLLLNAEGFVLNIDTKWKSHPDANTVPREEWYGHKSVEDLYCLAIVKDVSVRSLRDLRGEHVPLLRATLEEGPPVIEQVYGVTRDQLRIFVHYLPQFYHFHVHFTRLENEIGCQVERGHLLADIIQNLDMNGEYYALRNITYKLRTSDQLFKSLQKANDSCQE